MRAMAIEGFGGPEKLTPLDLPRPRPGSHELLIRVVAAGVNPVDWKIREGRLADRLPHEFPLIPGWDVAGVVEGIGEKIAGFRKGDRVWACCRKPTVQWGCYAEYVTVAESSAARMPAKLLYEEAASVPLAALTACQALLAPPGIERGSRVMIHAASGGVGHFALQLARNAGADLFASTGPTNQAFVSSLGARVVVDHTREDFRDVVRRHAPEGIDLVLCSLDREVLERSHEIVRTGGRLVSITGEPDPALAERYGIRSSAISVEPDGERLAWLARRFDDGELRTHVQKIYRLTQAPEAQCVQAEGHVRGKLVLNL